MVIRIFHENWKIITQSDKAFDNSHGEAHDAITYLNNKTIFFRKTKVLKNIVKHELAHVVYSYMIDPVDLSLDHDQAEEFVCEFLVKYGNYLETITDELYKKICQN